MNADPMLVQLRRNGFVHLKNLLPSRLVDEMAHHVSMYIARRGPRSKLEGSGYALTGITSDPTLVGLFENLNRSRELHSALARLFGAPEYRFMMRAEVVTDRASSWHTDSLQYS